jgi:hypothetical protein
MIITPCSKSAGRFIFHKLLFATMPSTDTLVIKKISKNLKKPL